MMNCRIGIDVGGTFTDVVLEWEDGTTHILKYPTQAEDIAAACLAAIHEVISKAEASIHAVSGVSHGTTVATNTIIQRSGARTALLATEGFCDVLDIARQVKPDRYNLHVMKPEPLVPRSLRIGVAERVLWDGQVEHAIDPETADQVCELVKEMGVEAVAICFLHSFANPANENALAEGLKAILPHLYISTSYAVSGEFREYPRTSTTVANAYVGPVVSEYLSRMEADLKEAGIGAPLTIFQSNGGLTSAAEAARLPVRSLYSGPAAGVQGALDTALRSGYREAITLDMGGTSCDVCLIQGGKALDNTEKAVAGYPIRAPSIDVHSIGAGGGSIAWIDEGGLLQVGPESAGADPGPAGYGRGGTRATVTDANIVLGRLGPENLLGGRLRLHESNSRAVISALGEQLGLSVEECALGILRIVNNNMIGAIRLVSVERGYDYRDCALVAFGGAGPLHATELAGELGMSEVIVPRSPGVLCAQGLLTSGYRRDFTRSRPMDVKDDTWEMATDVFAQLEQEAVAWSASHNLPVATVELIRTAFMRYRRQSYQLAVPASQLNSHEPMQELLTRFHSRHQALYGFLQDKDPVEIIHFHLRLQAPVARPTPGRSSGKSARDGVRPPKPNGRRLVWFGMETGSVETLIYHRDQLAVGAQIAGPAVIEQMDCTTLLPPHSRALVDPAGNLTITV